jgi:cystathionine beta-lyase/cystathionine gamma-synthase
MERHCKNAMLVAEFLQENFNNYEIIYPGLKSHKNYDIAKKQMNMFGGMVSIITNGNIENVREILNKFEVFTLAESLGGVESLVSHPATMTHASIPKEKREDLGIKDGLIRLSIGLETIDDILSDLKDALS